MNKQDQIHHQLRNFEEKQQTYFQKWNILNTKTNFREDAELSEWRTSSYPAIPKKQLSLGKKQELAKKDKSNNIMPENEAFLSPNQLSHRYTFINHHSSNQKLDKKEYRKKQPYILSLALPKRDEFPPIYNDQNKFVENSKKSFFLKMYSPKNSGTPYHFIKHADTLKNKMKDKNLTQNLNKIMWNVNDIEEQITMINRGKGKLPGNIRKSKPKNSSYVNPRQLNRETIKGLRKCLIFGKQEDP